MEVNRDNSPPEPGPEYRIVRLRANEEITLLVSSPSIWGFWTHWMGGKSAPCFRDKAKCPGHRLGMPSRWKGYLFGFDQESKIACYLEVTPQAARSILEQLPPGRSMRGMHLRFRRLNGDRARMKVQQVTSHDWSDKTPPDRDPYPTLAKLWGLSDRKSDLDRPNEPCFEG